MNQPAILKREITEMDGLHDRRGDLFAQGWRGRIRQGRRTREGSEIGSVFSFNGLDTARFLEDRSYSIYLLRGFGIAAICDFGARQFAKNPMIGAGILILSWISTLSLSLLFFHFVGRYFLRSPARLAGFEMPRRLRRRNYGL